MGRQDTLDCKVRSGGCKPDPVRCCYKAKAVEIDQSTHVDNAGHDFIKAVSKIHLAKATIKIQLKYCKTLIRDAIVILVVGHLRSK